MIICKFNMGQQCDINAKKNVVALKPQSQKCSAQVKNSPDKPSSLMLLDFLYAET